MEFDASKWFDENARQALLDRIGNLPMREYKAVLDHISEWAAEESAMVTE